MFLSIGMLKLNSFLADIFILSAEKQPIKLSWRKIECLLISNTQMFGIDDPFIILPYLLSVVCVVFAAWFGLKYWNKDDEKDETR